MMDNMIIDESVPRERRISEDDAVKLNSLVRSWSSRTKSVSSDTSNDDVHLPLTKTLSSGKAHWFGVVQKTKSLEDPWEQYNIIEMCPTEMVKRFRYNALKKKWVHDIVFVKMQSEAFGRGAMRKCFRMKKLSTTVHTDDWSYSGNIVAKIYIDENIMPKQYFDDVKLQMDAKLWAEEYNRKNPPKKVDIMQQACIKFIHREDQPMYHIEHFIEGNYVKYNSNSGFVLQEKDLHVRSTPQAFSHFTFERSGHQLIVVDVQGVGDLYTDPQIHTAHGEEEYGEANLGAKGMALFFGTHQCSEVCEMLCLEKFDLSTKEKERINDSGSRSSTSTELKPNLLSLSNIGNRKMSAMPAVDLIDRLNSVGSDGSPDEDPYSPRRMRFFSNSDSGISSSDEVHYFSRLEHKSTCAMAGEELTDDCINKRLDALANFEEQQVSILGKIHYELCTYNCVGRFTATAPDYASALFHLRQSALCGCLQANKILAYKYFNLSTDEFPDIVVKEDHDMGMDCLIEAATRNDKDCMIKTAQAFDTGLNLGNARTKSWTEALRWYEAALSHNEASGGFENFPRYEINARMAEIWRSGGYGVEKDPSYAGELYTAAADDAMNAGKGKLANRYFMIAEEAWAEVEE